MRLRLPKNTGRLVLTAAAIVLFVYLVRTLITSNSCDCSNCSVQSGGDDPAATKTGITTKPSATIESTTSTTSTKSDQTLQEWADKNPTESTIAIVIVIVCVLICVIAVGVALSK